jgi:predicted GNAT family acetyltransferase
MSDPTETAVPAVEREDGPARGRYVIHLSGGFEAEMTYRRIAPNAIAIDHTYTPPEFRGQNIAFRMMERAIADARRDGIKIRPECSYAVIQFRRHPDWADLLA